MDDGGCKLKGKQYTDVFYKRPCIFAINMKNYEFDEPSVKVIAEIEGKVVPLILSKYRFKAIQGWYEDSLFGDSGAFAYVETSCILVEGMHCAGRAEYFRQFERMSPSSKEAYDTYIKERGIRNTLRYQQLKYQLIRTLVEINNLQASPALDERDLCDFDDIIITKEGERLHINIAMCYDSPLDPEENEEPLLFT